MPRFPSRRLEMEKQQRHGRFLGKRGGQTPRMPRKPEQAVAGVVGLKVGAAGGLAWRGGAAAGLVARRSFPAQFCAGAGSESESPPPRSASLASHDWARGRDRAANGRLLRPLLRRTRWGPGRPAARRSRARREPSIQAALGSARSLLAGTGFGSLWPPAWESDSVPPPQLAPPPKPCSPSSLKTLKPVRKDNERDKTPPLRARRCWLTPLRKSPKLLKWGPALSPRDRKVFQMLRLWKEGREEQRK